MINNNNSGYICNLCICDSIITITIGDDSFMKKIVVLVILFCTIIILAFVLSKNGSHEIFKITENDEKVILEYLDKKTNDIAKPIKSNDKMYSAFKLLGTDQYKIYIWLVKMEYTKIGKQVSNEGNAVSVPVVLKINKNNKGISIISHKYPEDGASYGKNIKSLFPSNIKFPDYEDKAKLEVVTKDRAEKNF